MISRGRFISFKLAFKRTGLIYFVKIFHATLNFVITFSNMEHPNERKISKLKSYTYFHSYSSLFKVIWRGNRNNADSFFPVSLHIDRTYLSLFKRISISRPSSFCLAISNISFLSGTFMPRNQETAILLIQLHLIIFNHSIT